MELKKEETSHNRAFWRYLFSLKLGGFGYLVPTTPSSSDVQ